MTPTRFPTGATVELRYDRQTPQRVEMVMPVKIVTDTADLTIFTVRAGTHVQALGLANGEAIPRDLPYRDLAALPRVLLPAIWQRTDVVFITRPEWSWDVRLYRDATNARFLMWYLNLQDPLERTGSGFRTTDHLLDIVVTDDLEPQLKDEIEFAQALELGMYTREEYEAILDDAEDALSLVRSGAWPFDSDPVSMMMNCFR